MNQKIRTSAQAVLPLRIPQMGEIPQKYLEKIQKNSEFENSEFEREREGEREREREKEETNCCQLFKLIRYLYLSHEPSAWVLAWDVVVDMSSTFGLPKA